MVRKLLFLILLYLCIDVYLGYGIRMNCSESLPFKLFVSRPYHSESLKGKFVKFRSPVSDYYLVKEVAGISGDRIKIKEHTVFVSGEERGVILLETPNTHTKMTPIQEGVIPEGYIYAYSYHKDSFDSRYQEIGLIPVSQIQEVLCPIF